MIHFMRLGMRDASISQMLLVNGSVQLFLVIMIICIYLWHNLRNRRENNSTIIKRRLEKLESYEDYPICDRVDLLNDVFDCISQYFQADLNEDEAPDNTDYVIQ